MTVPTMLLASPLGWVYYFPALLLPFLWLWKTSGDLALRRARVALVAAWLLAAAPVVSKDSRLGLTILPFLGLSALWVGSLVAVRRAGGVGSEGAAAL